MNLVQSYFILQIAFFDKQATSTLTIAVILSCQLQTKKGKEMYKIKRCSLQGEN